MNNAVLLVREFDYTAAIETLLFLDRAKQDIGTLSRRLNVSEKEIRRSLIDLESRYESPESGLARNTVHLDHSKRLMPITEYGSCRSPNTVHPDHQLPLNPITFGGGIL